MNQLSLSAINFAWLPILPLITVTVAAMVVLLVGVWSDEEESEGLGVLSLGFLAVGFILALPMLGGHGSAFSGALAIDDFSVYFELIILISGAITVLMSLDYVAEIGLPAAEYYALLMFALLGMLLMAAAGDLIIIFLGLETMSIAVYALAGFMRKDPRSSEASLKYFLMGAFSTGFLLYGIALIYGATGSIRLEAIRQALFTPHITSNPLLLLGLGMLLIGFGFKVAAVPFHMWTPDAYEGAPTPVTGFMAVGVKLAAFAGFLRIFQVHLVPVSVDWMWVVWVVAALTMTVGNLVAVVQSNIKRMLAYSAIAHAGYILVGMAAVASPEAGGAILYYLLGYAFTNLGAFAVVSSLERRGERHNLISDYRGLASRHPALAAAMAIFMFSLTGIPPLSGFVGKFYLFSAALSAGLIGLVIIAVLNSVLSAYYYLSVVATMYTGEDGVEIVRLGARPALVAGIVVAAIGTVLIGIYPQPYMGAATSAFASAFGAPLHHATALLFH
jgi:NADH-quinone oxidoreductase subunit N